MFKQYNFILILLLLFSNVACNDKQEEEPSQKNYLLQKLSTKDTGVNFINQLKEDVDHSIINYIYFYNGSGLCAGDINNDGLSDLYFVSNQGENKLYLNKGSLKFEDISEKANVNSKSDWNTGATMVDINNDGLLDIYLCSVSGLLDFKGHNELFINNGDGSFTEQAKEYGLDFTGYSTQSYFFDYDKDDDLDVFIVNHAIHTNLSYGPAEHRNRRTPLVGDVLLKNENGKFIDVSEEAKIYGGPNGYGLSASIADFNNDGWDDIYVCNDFHEDDYYYLNNQDGTFSESLSTAFSTISRFSMGSDAADINGDGFQDLITLDMLPDKEHVIKESEGDDAMYNMYKMLNKLGYRDQYSRNMLQMNNEGGYFQETALFNRVADTDWSWGPLFADFNNDGHQDLFICNGILRRPNDLDFKKYVSSTFKKYGNEEGVKWLYKSINEMPNGESSNRIFKGNSKKFEDKTGEWIIDAPSLSNGGIYIDLDLDGDLDIVTNNLNGKADIFKNTINDTKNYISLKFNYKGKNKEGIGTKAVVFSNNKSQLKQLFKSRGFLSSGEDKLYFGLDTINTIDSVHIIWPNNTIQRMDSVMANQNLVINFSDENPKYKYRNITDYSKFKKTNAIEYVHSEDSYDDFFYERLIPYRVSRLGPAIAIADIDNNGFEDVFLGNASGKKPKLLLNNGVEFIEKPIPEIDKDKMSEDNEAVFFDADNDGDLDLYVASGIDVFRRNAAKNDRLYINNNGHFERAKNNIPENTNNTSTVQPYDYDKDGDVDLFIGNLSKPYDFGATVESYILVNDGKGFFKKDKNFTLKAKVTSAIWNDLNNNGIKDLLISTEWDTPKVYLNKEGVLSETHLPNNINGLWQTIITYDIDADGDQDILLGNWGKNTRFNVSSDQPLRMYYSDFDNNKVKETVLAYEINGKYYPVNSKDELASQMNVINKRFNDFEDFSFRPIEDVLTAEALEKAEISTIETLASGYLQNNEGSFTEFIELKDELQLAPINSFVESDINGDKGLIVNGNTYKVGTYHGAYTAFKGAYLKSENDIELLTNYGIEPFNGQVKTSGFIKMKNSKLFFVLTNNEGIKTYTTKTP